LQNPLEYDASFLFEDRDGGLILLFENCFRKMLEIAVQISVSPMLSTISLSQQDVGQAWDKPGTEDVPVIFEKSCGTVGCPMLETMFSRKSCARILRSDYERRLHD
jgi:hypothetical protein